ncbi:MAG: helix-turn-helix domain-containing protein [Minicystis sp.]
MSRAPLPEDGRARRRVEAMRRAQDAALDLFEARGYAAVTVEDIAAAAGVGPATVYRSFGSKERVVLWDDYDPMLLDAVRARLPTHPLLAAVSGALEEALDRVYGTDKRRILRRTRLLLAEPALIAASAADRLALRAALAALFTEASAAPGDLGAEVAAAAVVATLEVAVERWAKGRGRTPMREVIRASFGALARLG